jgi:tetratricopeptide (TPR) repeat protein
MFVWLFIYTSWKFKSKNFYVFCFLFYIATLSVSSNIVVMIAATMADRFLFVPSLGFTLAVAGGILSVFKIKLNEVVPLKWVALTPALVIAIYWASATHARNPVWQSNYTLFKSGTIDAPKSYRTNRAFAVENLVSFQKDTTRASLKEIYKKDMLTYYRKAMEIYPKLADDCFNIALCYYYNNNLDSAKIWYANCISINPNYINSHYNLAMLYSNEKNHEQALKHFLEVKRINPDFLETNFKIGLHYHYQGKFAEAIPYYEQYLSTHPNNTDVLTNLSLAYLGLKQIDKYNYYQQLLAKARTEQAK